MGKRKKRIKIKKNKDIEELIETAESENVINDMSEIIAQIDQKRQKFIESLKRERESINRRIQIGLERKDAEFIEEQKRAKLWKTISRMKEEQLNKDSFQEIEER